MKTLSWLWIVIVVAVVVRGKSSDDDVLKDVLREQMNLIKHCMSTRCSCKGYHGHNDVKFARKNVAFFAYPSRHVKDIPANTKIIFDKATENVGSAYNPKDGVFTAPVDGVYAFHWTTLIYPGRHFVTHLKVEGVSKAYNFGYASHLKEWLPTSQAYVGHLKKGNKVWLSTDGTGGLFIHQGHYTTFSGYLL